jgi:hypothetical protein
VVRIDHQGDAGADRLPHRARHRGILLDVARWFYRPEFIKQLIDLLRQLAEVAPMADTRQAAASAHERLFRGVVAASAAVDVDVEA